MGAMSEAQIREMCEQYNGESAYEWARFENIQQRREG